MMGYIGIESKIIRYSSFGQSNLRDNLSVRSVDLEPVDSWFEKDLCERTDLLDHRSFYPSNFHSLRQTIPICGSFVDQLQDFLVFGSFWISMKRWVKSGELKSPGATAIRLHGSPPAKREPKVPL